MMLLLLACTDGDTPGSGMELRLSLSDTVGSVVELSVRTGEPTTLSVDFGVGDLRDHHLDVVVPAASHQLHLYGLPFGEEVGVTVTSTDNAGTEASDTSVIQTGSLPSDFPGFSTDGAVQSWQGRYALLNTAGSANYAFILDSEGRVCWAWLVDLEADENLMRAHLGQDRETMYLLVAGRGEEAAPRSRVLRVPLYGGEADVLEWPNLDHDIIDVGSGTLAGIVRVKQGNLWGDAIVERDPAGGFTTVYSTWDDAALGEPVANSAENTWTHMESLDWDADLGLYSYQTFLTDHFVRVQRSDGIPTLHLYGTGSDYAPADGEVPLHVAHQFQVLSPTNILHFENGDRDRSASRAVEYALDNTTGTYREVWSYQSSPPLYVYIKGDVNRFDDGATQVLWATAGRIEDVNGAGSVDWSLQLDLGAVFTYMQHLPALGNY